MKQDWLIDFLGWIPVLLILLAAAAMWALVNWRFRRLKRSLERLKRTMILEAESGQPCAQFQVGRMYREGDGVSRNPSLADEWFRKALPGLEKEAEAGDGEAASCLYDCFHEGLGVEKDDAQASFWLQRAAEEEEAGAMFTLALEYREGGLVEKNDDLFLYWLRKAAEEGNEGDAQYLLGACYEHGNGVPQDLNLAQKWYNRASENLVSGADDALERLEGK